MAKRIESFLSPASSQAQATVVAAVATADLPLHLRGVSNLATAAPGSLGQVMAYDGYWMRCDSLDQQQRAIAQRVFHAGYRWQIDGDDFATKRRAVTPSQIAMIVAIILTLLSLAYVGLHKVDNVATAKSMYTAPDGTVTPLSPKRFGPNFSVFGGRISGHELDLSGKNLARLELYQATIEDVRFEGAVMTNVSACGASKKCEEIGFIRRCSFAGADMSLSCIGQYVFEDCDFSGANLSGCDLRGCKFVRCLFANTRFKTGVAGETTKGATAQECKLYSVRFVDCKIDNSTYMALHNCRLRAGAVLPPAPTQH